MLFLLACTAPCLRGAPDSEIDGADDAGDDSGGADAPGGYACPAEMAPVPADDPAWCIDRYEVTVTGGTAAAVADVVPTVAVSFEEAEAICAATPAMDGAGEPYAWRRIATAAEWEDAGDGVLGEGGTRYPWGDLWEDDRCVTPTQSGEVVYTSLQPTGSKVGCASAGGAFDLVGNAWEWTDSGVRLDAAGALAALAAAGFPLDEDDEGVRLVAGDPAELMLEVAGVSTDAHERAPEGYLEVPAAALQTSPEFFFARGYLVAGDGRLAVRLAQLAEGDDAPWRFFVAYEYDGRALPDKRGCAYYVGNDYACALSTPSLIHLPDFDGTIGFRCVAPPYPETYASAHP